MSIETMDPFADIADLLLDAIVIVDLSGKVVAANAACLAVFGYTPEELTGKTLFDHVVPEDRAKTWEESLLVMSGTPRIGFENRYIRKDGSIAHIMWSARCDAERQLRIGVARDITAKKRAEAVQMALYQIAALAHGSDGLSQLLDETHRIVSRLVSVAGMAVIDARVKHRLNCLYQSDSSGKGAGMVDEAARQLVDKALQEQQPVVSDLPGATGGAGMSLLAAPLSGTQGPVGALILKSHPGMRFTDDDTKLLHFVSSQVAVALERRWLLDELTRSARYDDLTGLPNRRLFYDRLETALSQSRRRNSRSALLYLDIDGFKQINDTLGHTAGDELLRVLARRIKKTMREEDTVARLGGDEFVVLLPHVSTLEAATGVAEKIRTTCNEMVWLDRHLVEPRLSIGVAIYPDQASDATQLMKLADQSMYEEKRRTKQS
ncbi:sensor domain-containing protein [Noviherbaspirillum galbum]|uniref:Diguanylate cyclase n=1 Tax=Noviherbaspirillum galbum TaxID=2709383 RepID=A0A6B3SY26_9BURK|nr:diguanylate cyclase [Noviherbaspirillum galbum]NEX64146.1 diguanylate cyclase [Noviherbaspirillum galbum]